MSGRNKGANNAGRLKVLCAYRKDPGASLQELVDATGLSKTAVYYHLCNLIREGVIARENKPRGPKVRQRHTHMISAKKAEAGRKGKGDTAFVPRKTKRTDKLQERIEMVVAQAKAREGGAGYDVVQHDPHRLRLGGAHKVG